MINAAPYHNSTSLKKNFFKSLNTVLGTIDSVIVYQSEKNKNWNVCWLSWLKRYIYLFSSLLILLVLYLKYSMFKLPLTVLVHWYCNVCSFEWGKRESNATVFHPSIVHCCNAARSPFLDALQLMLILS